MIRFQNIVAKYMFSCFLRTGAAYIRSECPVLVSRIIFSRIFFSMMKFVAQLHIFNYVDYETIVYIWPHCEMFWFIDKINECPSVCRCGVYGPTKHLRFHSTN